VPRNGEFVVARYGELRWTASARTEAAADCKTAIPLSPITRHPRHVATNTCRLFIGPPNASALARGDCSHLDSMSPLQGGGPWQRRTRALEWESWPVDRRRPGGRDTSAGSAVRVLQHDGRQAVGMDDICPPIAAPLGDVTTERLVLCRFDLDVLDELAHVFDKREVWQFPYGRGMTRAETADFLDAQIRHWDDFGFGCWMARERQNECLIGYVGLSIPTFLPDILPAVEVGWRFAPTSWGNGYATEGATAALDEAFSTLGLSSVCSLPQVDNPRSVHVAERLSMHLVREVSVPATDQRGEVVASHYEISRDEWWSNRRRP